MSKKILSLALAVVMLFSICAVAASAVQGNGTENIRIYMTSDAKVGAPAGTVVKVSYYVDLPVAELQMCIGNIAIGWNSAAYAIKSSSTSNAADARTWGPDFGQYMLPTAAVTVSATLSNNILKKGTAEEKAKWDKACQVQMAYDNTNSKPSVGLPVYDNQLIFTLEFVAQRTLTADDVIGVVTGAYGQSFFKVCWFNGTTTAQVYPAAQVNMADAAVVPAAAAVEYDVYKLSAPRKHSNGDGTNTVAVFFAFDSIAPDFNTAGTSQFISAIAATVTATSGSQSITVESDPIKYVYDLGEGEYGFRVILKNVPDAADITVVPAVTTTDSAKYDVETVSFNVADATAA